MSACARAKKAPNNELVSNSAKLFGQTTEIPEGLLVNYMGIFVNFKYFTSELCDIDLNLLHCLKVYTER